MALGADFYVDIFLCRTCYKCVATVAGNGCLIIIRMDSFLHDFHLFLYDCELLTAALLPKPISGQCCSDVATARYPGLSLQVPAVRFSVCGPKMSLRHKTTFVFYHTAFQKARFFAVIFIRCFTQISACAPVPPAPCLSLYARTYLRCFPPHPRISFRLVHGA